MSANLTASSTFATASSSSFSRSFSDTTSSSIRRFPNVSIGSRLRHSSTSSFVRYSSGSAIEWPRKRYVTASTSCGLRSSRAQRTASAITASVSSTSMPSHWLPGTPNPSAFFERSVTAECRSSDVPIPNWLLITMKTTGSFHNAARFIVSPNVPWFVAPSPNMHSITSLSSR